MKKFILIFVLFYYGIVFSIGQANVQVCGTVFDASGWCPGFEGVQINIKDANGNVICSTLTDADGNYCCDINESQFPILICPKIECTNQIGIENLDLVVLQNYILGLPGPGAGGTYPPYFHYWADVNGDGSINTVDLVLLRKLILGIFEPGDLEFPNACRIVSEDCLLRFGGVPWAWQLCLTPPENANCTWIESVNPGLGTGINFHLFHIGDVNQSGQDLDCIKPLKEDSPVEIRKENNDAIELILKKEKDYYTLGFRTEHSFNMLIYSLPVGSINKEDVEILNDQLDVFLDDGYLHISYFSNKLTDILLLENMIRFKNPVFLDQDMNNAGMLLNSDGTYSDILFYAKDTFHNLLKESDSGSVESGQIIQVIKQDGTYIDVAQYKIKSGATVELQEKIHLASGIYFLTIKGDTTGKIYHQKVVIIH